MGQRVKPYSKRKPYKIEKGGAKFMLGRNTDSGFPDANDNF